MAISAIDIAAAAAAATAASAAAAAAVAIVTGGRTWDERKERRKVRAIIWTSHLLRR